MDTGNLDHRNVLSAPRLSHVLFILRNDEVDRLAQHLRNAVAKDPFGCATDRQDSCTFINRHDRIAGGLFDDLVPLSEFFHFVSLIAAAAVIFLPEQWIYQMEQTLHLKQG